MGLKARRFPPILQFSLFRFDIDYSNFSRFKVNDRFEFPLEIDMKPYLIADSE